MVIAEMKELDKQLQSSDEMTRVLADMKKVVIMQRLRDEGCIEWESEL